MTIDINELRRKVNSTDIVDHIDLHANIKPFLSELLDRLEAAEADALEQARLNGMGAEREAALLAKLEAAEKSDAESLAMYRRARDERDALKDKIERMEQQRPFAWIVRGGYPVPLENLEWQLLCGAERPTLSWTNQEMRPLYALPGAHPAPSVPDDIVREVLRDCCGTFHGSRHRITCEKYKGKRD